VSGGSLRQRAASGARWTSLSALMAIGAQMVQLAILARLLDPREFGLAASAMIIVGLLSIVSEGGITNAIIARQTTDRDVLSSLYWANVLIGAALALVMIAVIPAATAYFGQPDLADLMLLAAPSLIIAPIGQVYGAILEKELIFSPLARIEMGAAIAGSVVAVISAASGLGAAAIIYGYLAQTATRALCLAIRGWHVERPRMHLRRRDLDGYIRFGAYQMGERTINYFGSNLDYALIGGFLSQTALGIYSVAFRLVTIPQMRLNPILTRVAFPVFAKRQEDDDALRRGFLELTTMVAYVSFPVMVGFALTAPRLIPVVFGPLWAESVPILQILAILGALFSLGNLTGAVFLAKNRPDLGLKINLLRLALIAVSFPIALGAGLQAVAWAFVGVAVLMFFVLRRVLGRLMGLSTLAYLSALSRPTLISAAMAATVLASTPLLATMLGGDAIVLIMQAVVGAVAYVGFTLLFARAWATELWKMIRGAGRTPVAAETAR
jgi:lipopolysaccharide exporter